MTNHLTGTRKEWLAARLELLEAEKELTKRSDAVAQRRQALPWVRIDKGYRFETEEGSATLADPLSRALTAARLPFHVRARLQGGMPVLLGDRGRVRRHRRAPANHDVTLSAVSRAPLAKLQAYKQRMGWTFPWASSAGGDFNFDFNVSFTEEQQRERGIEYNFQREPRYEWRAGKEGGGKQAGDSHSAMCGTDPPRTNATGRV